MIQRKQSLFLLIVAALMTAMLFMSLAESTTNVVDQQLQAVDGTINRVMSVNPSVVEMDVWRVSVDGQELVAFPYFAAVVILCAVIAFLAIFLYRKRLVQIRLCYVLGILLIGVMVFEALYYYRLIEMTSANAEAGYTTIPHIANAFPLVSLVLVWLANKGIIRDEALVRAADRIR